MFEKEAEEWRNSLNYEIDNDTFNNIVIPCIEFGYNKANEDVKHDLMMKLKDEGIVKPLKDSILRNERLSSQEQQELCAWTECAMYFGENLDECAKELEEANKANEWHYVKDGDLPNKELEEKQLLVRVRNYTEDYILAYYMLDKYYSPHGKRFYCDTECDSPINIKNIIAWKEIVPPKESE